MTLRDEGISAFRGKHRDNPDTAALAGFLHAVKSGRVPAGSYLIVESLDRLSREKIRPALTLLLNLIESGIKVVQLIPVEAVYDEDVDAMVLMQAIMELNRGHSESKVKSERVGAAWAKKRKDAASKVVTRRLPGWIRFTDGKLSLIHDRAAVVLRVFGMARDGAGVHAIATTLNTERIPVMGRKEFRGRPVRWNETVVYHLLTSRATFGEFQPHIGRGSDRTPIGEPVPNYFPPAIDRDMFYAAQAALKSRSRHGSGRRGAHVKLFAGLIRDWRDGGSMTYKHLKSRSSAIIPVGAKQGTRAAWSSFPAVAFERTVLSQLIEVRAADVHGGAAGERVAVLSGRKAELDALVKLWTAKMDDPNIIDTVAAKLSSLNAELKTVTDNLADAQREASSSVAEAHGEFLTVARLLANDPSDELRVKVRGAVRRTVDRMDCLFLPSVSRERFAIVKVLFRDGAGVRVYALCVSSPSRTARIAFPADGGRLVPSKGLRLGWSHRRRCRVQTGHEVH